MSARYAFLRQSLLWAALLGAAASLGARTVEDYVHGGSAKYIQGRLQEAGVEVEEGLRKHPGDARLKALADQLKKMKDQKKQDQGGQGSGGESDKDKQEKPDSSGQGDRGKQDGDKDQKKDQEKQEQDKQDQDPEKGKDGQGKDEKPEPEEGKQDSAGGQAAPAKPGEMTKEEAERLLNSYQDDEKREQKQLQKRKRRPVEVEEDW